MSMESYLNNIKNQQSQNREHIMHGQNKDGKTITEFFSRDRFDNEKSESDLLEETNKRKAFHHDALHAVSQAKLDSLGVKHIRVTSMENELMVTAMIMASEKLRNQYGGDSLKNIQEMMVNEIKLNFPDAQDNPDKYEDYAANLFKLYTQTAALTKKILNNEGDSFKNHLDVLQESFNDEENDIYGDGEEVTVRSGFESDPVLNKEYEKEVALINKTVEDLEMIKALKGIDN